MEIYFLGNPRILRQTQEASMDTRKAMALLAYLVETGEPHSRDHLAAFLLPELDPSRARAAQRRAPG